MYIVSPRTTINEKTQKNIKKILLMKLKCYIRKYSLYSKENSRGQPGGPVVKFTHSNLAAQCLLVRILGVDVALLGSHAVAGIPHIK